MNLRLVLPLYRSLTLVICTLFLSIPSFAYEEDTHFSMTYVICRSVGFSPDEAMIVAAVDQGMDDSPGVVANTDLGPISGGRPHPDEEWKWHALDGYGWTNGGSMKVTGILARRDLLFAAAVNAPDKLTKLRLLGVFFHYQQDTWAHRHHYASVLGKITGNYAPNHLSPTDYTTYNTPAGHAKDGHAPDRPPFDPAAAVWNFETGIAYARSFLSNGLKRIPGDFFDNYTPQGGDDDSTWTDPRKGMFFHEISLSGATQNSARAYVLNLIRAQVGVYKTSKGNVRYLPHRTPDQADLTAIKNALEEVCGTFQPYRSKGIDIPQIIIPTVEEKVKQGYMTLTTPQVESWFNTAVSKAKQFTSAANVDQRLEVFYVGMNANVYHNWQTPNSGNGWKGQTFFGAQGTQVSNAQAGPGRSLEIFLIGTDTKIYHNRQTSNSPSGWEGFTTFEGQAKQIVLATNSNGSLELFYIGTDNHIYHNYQLAPGGKWNGQSEMAGLAKQITVAKNSNGILELFYIGTNDKIYHNWQEANKPGGWHGQEYLGGSAKQISVTPNSTGALEIFYVGTNNKIYYNWQDSGKPGGWNGQAVFGGSANFIAAAINRDGRLEIFYSDTKNNLYHNYQIAPGGKWSGGVALGGTAKQITVSQNEDRRLQIFYIGTDDILYRNRQEPSAPGGWDRPEPL